MRITAVIPARYNASRFPGKVLADLHGKPMIQWVYERTVQSPLLDRVLVATDDERILQAVTAFGGEAVMTRPDHASGTDRLAEIAGQLNSDLIVNVQGDEPLISPRMISDVVSPLRRGSGFAMGTLMSRITTREEFFDPNVVKVVTDRHGFALYFSRAPIPLQRDSPDGDAEDFSQTLAFRHVGLYVYRRDFLQTFPKLSPTPLEKLERLEQLRALEHGFRIKVFRTDQICFGVDTPQDLENVKTILAASHA